MDIAFLSAYGPAPCEMKMGTSSEEFIAILYDIFEEVALYEAAEKVRALIASSRLDIDDHSLTLTASIPAIRPCP
jgi:hypothetical protein